MTQNNDLFLLGTSENRTYSTKIMHKYSEMAMTFSTFFTSIMFECQMTGGNKFQSFGSKVELYN